MTPTNQELDERRDPAKRLYELADQAESEAVGGASGSVTMYPAELRYVASWLEERLRPAQPELERLREALVEARPYVHGRVADKDWRGETAREVLSRVDAALSSTPESEDE